MSDRFEVVQEDGDNVGLAPDIGHAVDDGPLSNQRWTYFGDAILVAPPLPRRTTQWLRCSHEPRTLHQPLAIVLKEVGQE
jgi:hypothetical protein